MLYPLRASHPKPHPTAASSAANSRTSITVPITNAIRIMTASSLVILVELVTNTSLVVGVVVGKPGTTVSVVVSVIGRVLVVFIVVVVDSNVVVLSVVVGLFKIYLLLVKG